MNNYDPAMLSDITGIIICLIMSAFFSGSETTLTSITTSRAKMLLRQSSDKWAILNLWLDGKKRILATLLLGNNLVNILSSILAYRVASRLIPNWAEAISVFGLTLVILIFSEITPKSFAIHHYEKMAIPVLRIVWVLDKLLYPLSLPLSKLPLLLSPGMENFHDDPVPTEDEIKYHIKRGLDESIFDDKNQGHLLLKSINFTETLVKEVMIPRTEMTGLEKNTTLEEGLDSVISSGHSRLPVYDETPDHIIGILYAKDLLAAFKKHEYHKDLPVEKLLHKDIFYAPEIQKISLLLTDMRRRSSHMAIVVDEFGGTAGIITLEDIIEELVGEIQDEHDMDDDPDIKEVEKNRWQVNAHLPIADFQEKTGLALPDSSDYESVGGFVVSAFGRVPRKGKSITVEDFYITIVDSDDRHVKRVEIKYQSQDEKS
ncbi:MAG: HlyC/CorC family transporter [Deltaproteobacteria bacterium]|nr:HlyC/CorC family transporter [Deltaproteobacteria bacterium]